MLLWRISALKPVFIIRNCVQKCGRRHHSSVPDKKDTAKVKEIKRHVINRQQKAVQPVTGGTDVVETADHSGVQKPILLYSNERSQHFRRIFGLNVLQFMFWIFFANQGISLLVRKPKKVTTEEMQTQLAVEGVSAWDQMKILWADNPSQLLFSAVALTFGHLSMILLSTYAMRTIRYVTLAPGGHAVRLTTFSVMGAPNRYRHYDVPLTSVSSHVSRSEGGVMPIKVKGKWFYYILDTKRGQFLRPKLFDETVGTFRVLK